MTTAFGDQPSIQPKGLITSQFCIIPPKTAVNPHTLLTRKRAVFPRIQGTMFRTMLTKKCMEPASVPSKLVTPFRCMAGFIFPVVFPRVIPNPNFSFKDFFDLAKAELMIGLPVGVMWQKQRPSLTWRTTKPKHLTTEDFGYTSTQTLPAHRPFRALAGAHEASVRNFLAFGGFHTENPQICLSATVAPYLPLAIAFLDSSGGLQANAIIDLSCLWKHLTVDDVRSERSRFRPGICSPQKHISRKPQTLFGHWKFP